MNKLKKTLRHICSIPVYTSGEGQIFLPESGLVVIDEKFLKENINENIDFEDSDIFDFLSKHFEVSELITFVSSAGMATSALSLFSLNIEFDRIYLILDFEIIGEYWLLGCLTSIKSPKLLEKFLELLLLRAGDNSQLPFQILYNAPLEVENHSSDLISKEALNKLIDRMKEIEF